MHKYNKSTTKYKDVPMEENNFMNWYSIYGASGFTYGIKDIMPVPGGRSLQGQGGN